ncbi:MAG: 50S ribosomal protein L24e [Candidatus Micrarchaeia archaeon]
MTECSFCGNKIPVGTGFTLFKRDGTAIHYCSRKCEANARMGRNPRRKKWTKKFVKGQ